MGGGRKEGGGRVTLNSLGSGWFRFRGWFALGWMDGWSVGGSRLVCLVCLVWSGLVWLYSRLGEELLLVLFCLFVRSIRAVCCIQYTVYSIQYSFCLCAFDVNLRWETLS